MTEETQEPENATRRRWPLWVGGFLLLLLLALMIAWSQRKPLAANFIDRELARRGVTGSYEITQFAPTRQRIENLVIGDPDDPDLTAQWAELHVRLGFGVPEVRRIVAHGVRLRGELIDGRLTFGQVDDLLPEPTGEPIKLPEIDVTVSDARVRLATPYGPVVATLAGSGPLNDGFAGYVAAGSPAFNVGDCRARRLRLNAAILITGRRPAVKGPLRADAVTCPDLRIAEPRLAVDAIFSESFERWGGGADLSLASLAQSRIRAGPVRGRIEFDGSADKTAGTVTLTGTRLRTTDAMARNAALNGHYRVTERGGAMAFDGDVRFSGGRAGRALYAGFTDRMGGAQATPLGPIAAALARATERAAARFDANFTLAAERRGDRGAVRLARLNGRSASGARLAFGDGEGIQYRWPGRGVRIDGTLSLAGGGFPSTHVALSQARAGAALDGYATIAPMSAGNARLVLAPVRFTAGGDGVTRIATAVEISGPIADGRVEQLRLPVSGVLGRGGVLSVGQGCVPMRWTRLHIASLAVGPTNLPLCPIEGGALLRFAPGRGISGGARITNPRLRATLGEAPLLVTARDFRLPLRNPSFVANDVAVRLGEQGRQSALDIASLQANFVTGGVDGRYVAAAGDLVSVPIHFGNSSGTWRFVRGMLDVAGIGDVTSTSPAPVFEPMVTRDFALHLENNRITVTGGLIEPESNVLVANVNLHHNLGQGMGEARLDTPGISFNDRFQPTDLTNLVLGIVANVKGLVSGSGTIRWGSQGVTSDGVYQLTNVDLAAAFGPVKGLTSEVHFTDLLGMNTMPGQIATMREVNPGVLVEDGTLTYQLLAANKVRIEGGRWPFAGGELILDPTTLDFGVEDARRMTFRVEGVDAFQFLEARDFENIIATGMFDGELPIVIDNDGARIEDGLLVSRPGGGTFSYTGEISDVNLGLFGSLAFNALELIRYSEMAIGFDGAIDGEMVTTVSFTGVTPNIAREGQNFLVAGFTRRFAELPIEFNITINAPFNRLLYSFRLLDDPTFLVNQAIRARMNRIRAERTVQPTESDPVP